MIKLLFSGGLILAALTSCGDQQGYIENSIKYKKPELQSAFITEMNINGIEYRIGDEGKVWYNQKYYDDVQRIGEKVISDFYPANHYWNPNEVIQTYFKQRLIDSNIPFETKDFKGKPHITWSQVHKTKVDQILGETLEHEHELKKQAFRKTLE